MKQNFVEYAWMDSSVYPLAYQMLENPFYYVHVPL